MAKHPEREYGLGDSTSAVQGPPRVIGQAPVGPCPSCQCDTLYEIEVIVKHPRLRGHVGVGRYLGCPACPFASPMLMVARTPTS